MKTEAPEITCDLRQCEEVRARKGHGTYRLLFLIGFLAFLSIALYTTPERFREYEKAQQEELERHAQMAKDQANAPVVVER